MSADPAEIPSSPGTILLCYRGSIAHGTYIPSDDPDSIDDRDFLGIVVPPIRYYFGLAEWYSRGTREVFEGDVDLVEYEIRKMVSLLLKCNPNVLGTLWLDPEFYLKVEPEGQLLLDNREIFSSRKACEAFCGYAASQLQQMGRTAGRGFRGKKREELVTRYGYDTKNAAHCIRLLRMGIEFLESGVVRANRKNIDADELLTIKKGAWSADRVITEAQKLFQRAKEAREVSPLPEGPNYEGAEALLISIVQNRVYRS